MEFTSLTKKEKKAYNRGDLAEKDAIELENSRIAEAEKYDCRDPLKLEKGYNHINKLIREKCIAFKKPPHIVRMEIEKANEENIMILEYSRHEACGIGSKKLKLRLNKLKKSGDKVASVLRNLIEAEDSNISAKKYFGKYRTRYYENKEMYLMDSINDMKELEWTFGYSREVGKNAKYVMYVYLPNGSQLSWHMVNDRNMVRLPEIDVKWDGLPATTLTKLYDYVMVAYPDIAAM
jgi:hypothetical protein